MNKMLREDKDNIGRLAKMGNNCLRAILLRAPIKHYHVLRHATIGIVQLQSHVIFPGRVPIQVKARGLQHVIAAANSTLATSAALKVISSPFTNQKKTVVRALTCDFLSSSVDLQHQAMLATLG